MEPSVEIDDSLYSRQRYVLGDKAMTKMAKAKIFISGMNGLGIEIAKNVVLAGVNTVMINDHKKSSVSDMASHFYITKDNVGGLRSEISAKHLAELNSYVKVLNSNDDINKIDLTKLEGYSTVVLCDNFNRDTIEKINNYCHKNGIQFIHTLTCGVFASAFNDFGDNFDIFDVDGEQNVDFFISKAEKTSPDAENKVTTFHCIGKLRHDLQTGHLVKITEMVGLDDINNKVYEIKVIDPHSFSIPVDSSKMPDYHHGGHITQVKKTVTINQVQYSEALKQPKGLEGDFGAFGRWMHTHIAFLALYEFIKINNAKPKPWDVADAQKLVSLALLKAKKTEYGKSEDFKLDEKIVRLLSYTCAAEFAPLCATFGGLVGQEVLKSVTGKFSPLDNFFYFDTTIILADYDPAAPSSETKQSTETTASTSSETNKPFKFTLNNDRRDSLRIILGDEQVGKLCSSKLFVIGAGAIGCELMKNFAMLNAGLEKDGGEIVVTDMDVIEKSNLNRQFLFRPKDISKPKSKCASAAALVMNPDLKVRADLLRVGTDTEDTYTDKWILSRTALVNALDNIPARKYMDSRCVANGRPLLESGTLGSKGHVQTIYPFLTENYSSINDISEAGIPVCTLKSFPAKLEHTVEWARQQFNTEFFDKTMEFKSIRDSDSNFAQLSQIGPKRMGTLKLIDDILDQQPKSYKDCTHFARKAFQRYYVNDIMQLLHKYPADMKDDAGVPFWKLPKRCPKSLVFDLSDPLHLSYIQSLSFVWAQVWGITDIYVDSVARIEKDLQDCTLETFKPRDDIEISTDESKMQEEDEKQETLGEEWDNSQWEVQSKRIHAKIAHQINDKPSGEYPAVSLTPQEFEKDDDSNRHIDFITAAANLRSRNYGIAEENRVAVKRIAGKIIPAIATTTSVVSGLVAIELLKVVKLGKPPSDSSTRYADRKALEKANDPIRNSFINLALPYFQIAGVAGPKRSELTKSLSVTVWDQWHDKVAADMTLSEFMDMYSDRHGLEITTISYVSTFIYMNNAAYAKTKKRKLKKLLEKGHELLFPGTKAPQVWPLSLNFNDPTADEETPVEHTPPVSVQFKKKKKKKAAT